MTAWGSPPREQNRAIFWKYFRSTTSASNASGLAVRSRAQATAEVNLTDYYAVRQGQYEVNPRRHLTCYPPSQPGPGCDSRRRYRNQVQLEVAV